MSTAVSEVKAYYLSGVGHCNSAEIIHDHLIRHRVERTDSTWVSLQSIIGFGAENALKAYLTVSGMTRADLAARRFGHNLTKLLQEAEIRGLAADAERTGRSSLPAEIEKYISICGADYQSFNYRYIEGEKVSLLDPGLSTQQVIRGLQHLLRIVEPKAQLTV